MFGKNPVLKKEHKTDGQRLRVVSTSPFYTIQGEGPYVGMPAIFLRLHGCHLKCWFCDTEFSNPDDPYVHIDEIVASIDRFSEITKSRLVVITGGEPMRQNIVPLCKRLRSDGYTVQIETAGSFYLPAIEHFAELVVSPKTSFVHKDVARVAKAYKYVISAGTEIARFIPFADTQATGHNKLLAGPPDGFPLSQIYLSPMNEYDEDKNKANKDLVANLSLKYGVRAGIQLHKELGVAEPS